MSLCKFLTNQSIVNTVLYFITILFLFFTKKVLYLFQNCSFFSQKGSDASWKDNNEPPEEVNILTIARFLNIFYRVDIISANLTYYAIY